MCGPACIQNPKKPHIHPVVTRRTKAGFPIHPLPSRTTGHSAFTAARKAGHRPPKGFTTWWWAEELEHHEARRRGQVYSREKLLGAKFADLGRRSASYLRNRFGASISFIRFAGPGRGPGSVRRRNPDGTIIPGPNDKPRLPMPARRSADPHAPRPPLHRSGAFIKRPAVRRPAAMVPVGPMDIGFALHHERHPERFQHPIDQRLRKAVTQYRQARHAIQTRALPTVVEENEEDLMVTMGGLTIAKEEEEDLYSSSIVEGSTAASDPAPAPDAEPVGETKVEADADLVSNDSTSTRRKRTRLRRLGIFWDPWFQREVRKCTAAALQKVDEEAELCVEKEAEMATSEWEEVANQMREKMTIQCVEPEEDC